MQDTDTDYPTDQQIEDEMIERDIEYMEEALRGEHGEEAQQKQIKAQQLAQEREQKEARYAREIKRLTAALGSPALVKACMEEFDYALKLKSGEAIRFARATWHGNGWLTLNGVEIQEDMPSDGQLPFLVECGVDVRLEQILWVMYAPSGV